MEQQPTATTDDFQDLYEILQVSPTAENDTIQRVFRLLAQRYHPDNAETGNENVFQQLLKAYEILHDPVQRAAYDAQHRAQKQATFEVFDKNTEPNSKQAERKKREGILGALYQKRRHSPAGAGMNVREMEAVLGIPKEHLEFSLWFLKETHDIKAADNGKYTITAQGCVSYEDMVIPVEEPTKTVYLLPAANLEGRA
jgi:curved DNA-binding protein CbpA